MSEPVNHHYVSRCHLNEFFNQEKKEIYVYDKQLDNFYTKRTTKSLFSEGFSNTIMRNGKINNTELETQLKILFEDEFATHLGVVRAFMTDQSNMQSAFWSLNQLALIGILGELRNPSYKKSLDETMGRFESDMIKRLPGGLTQEPGDPKVKYKNVPDYFRVAFKILERMDPMIFSVFLIDSDDHFLLPDTSCFQIRANGAIGEILQIGVPVSDKIFILASSKNSSKKLSQLVTIHEDFDEEVLRINCDLANFAYKGIACSDMEFLKKTIFTIRGTQ